MDRALGDLRRARDVAAGSLSNDKKVLEAAKVNVRNGEAVVAEYDRAIALLEDSK